MARTNLARRIKPEHSELLTLRVIRRERVSPHFARVTLGRGDAERFRYMGFDQWFRLFIPVAEDSLSRLPNKLNAVSYAKFLTIAKTSRPVLRNYSVRAYRPIGPDGPELDVDFVLHGAHASRKGESGDFARNRRSSCLPGGGFARNRHPASSKPVRPPATRPGAR
ncbi:siderophore-interacting protein [Saccharopolyspora sp. 5N102]|uniref:siderophore-interacting protein n=1 Tax=Saccharopolyspora sp. 5N102 TaxID=3375155 RepID=UPI0037B9D5EF